MDERWWKRGVRWKSGGGVDRTMVEERRWRRAAVAAAVAAGSGGSTGGRVGGWPGAGPQCHWCGRQGSHASVQLWCASSRVSAVLVRSWRWSREQRRASGVRGGAARRHECGERESGEHCAREEEV